MYPSTNSNFLWFSRPLSTPMCSDDWPPKISTMRYGSDMWWHVQEMIWWLCEFLEVRIVFFFLIHFYVDLPTGPHFNLETKIDWLQGSPANPQPLSDVLHLFIRVDSKDMLRHKYLRGGWKIVILLTRTTIGVFVWWKWGYSLVLVVIPSSQGPAKYDRFSVCLLNPGVS